MSKTNGTHVTRVCVWQLALEAWIARNERLPSPSQDPIFSVYLRAQEAPQSYRYLRRWLAENYGEAKLASFDDLDASLSENVILNRLKGKSLEQLTELATHAQYAKRDLSKAYTAYKELLSNGKETDKGPSRKAPRERSEVVRPSRKANASGAQVGRAPSMDKGGA